MPHNYYNYDIVPAHSFNHHPDKSTLEDVTEAQQKIMLKQELTGSEGKAIRLYADSHLS